MRCSSLPTNTHNGLRGDSILEEIMARREIMSRLKSGDRLLLDGAMGTEIRKRSKKVNRQSATVDDPELVREIHDDYLLAGADIITTNTFDSGRVSLKRIGPPGANMEHYHRLATQIALEERDKLRPSGYVAGGISIPRGPQRAGTPGSVETYADYRAQSNVLADAGVDLLLYEFIGYADDCVAAATAGKETGLPVFLGLRWVRGSEGTMESHETFEELVSKLSGLRVDGMLPMCCNPPAATGALTKLSESFGGVLGAYPRVGDVTGDYTPKEFAYHAAHWLDAGAQIVGGCCFTRPAHIAALDPLVHDTRAA